MRDWGSEKLGDSSKTTQGRTFAVLITILKLFAWYALYQIGYLIETKKGVFLSNCFCILANKGLNNF